MSYPTRKTKNNNKFGFEDEAILIETFCGINKKMLRQWAPPLLLF